MDDLVNRLHVTAARLDEWVQKHVSTKANSMEAKLMFEAADRIEALEARIAKADALADILQSAIIEHDTADYSPDEENPWTMQEWFSDEDRAALAAYREGSDT